MELTDEQIIEKIYSSGILSDVETSKEYKELLHKYNEFYESIENEDLKEKFSKLGEIKNELYSESNKFIFKLGFSIATNLFIEATNFKK
jgi:uncharacterized membrane protein (DUF106 family)